MNIRKLLSREFIDWREDSLRGSTLGLLEAASSLLAILLVMVTLIFLSSCTPLAKPTDTVAPSFSATMAHGTSIQVQGESLLITEEVPICSVSSGETKTITVKSTFGTDIGKDSSIVSIGSSLVGALLLLLRVTLGF
jgi:hypothetical protein